MLEYLKKFERIIIIALIVMMITVVFLSAVERGRKNYLIHINSHRLTNA